MKKLVLSLFAVASLVPVAAMAQQPARVGGSTQAPQRVSYVAPVYPEEAKAARVAGIVIIEATIGTDGSVTEAHVIRSIAMLDMAAIAAVKQWKYTPTTLNGAPVPVIMTVTVNFTPTATGGTAAGGVMQSGAAPTQSAKTPPEPVFLNGREVLRIGGNVKAPERIRYVQPVYPEEAKNARVSGIVIIEAVVDESGHVASAKVLRSVLGLDEAAIAAVLQWEYTPTTLNGVPVPVLMTVTVNFTLQ